MIFLDTQRAYNKAWLDTILYEKWSIKEKPRNNKKTEHRTNRTYPNKIWTHEKIKLRDSIRQREVLSVIEYAILMDEITKEINENDMGLNRIRSTKMQNSPTRIRTKNTYQIKRGHTRRSSSI